MSSDQFDENREKEVIVEQKQSGGHTGTFVALGIGLVIALVACGLLYSRTNELNGQIAQMQDSTQSQISKLSDATTSLLDQRVQELNAAMQGASETTTAALKRTQADAKRQRDQLAGKIEEQQKQVDGQIGELKEAASTTDSKITEVSTNVDGVKTDVNGVKTDVNSVKADVASTQTGLEKTTGDLRRAMGDMGVMSGLIATNSKDLAALRELGERNYTEFTLSKKDPQKRMGDVTLTWKSADPKRNRYTVEVLANDQRVQKKDKTANEPVQLYVSGNRQPYEIVVNQVKKDEIIGYLATPKVTLARQ